MAHPTARTRRRLVALASAVSIAGLAGACAPSPEPEPNDTGEQTAGEQTEELGGSITIGVEAGSVWESFYTEAATRFTAETGVEVEILAVPHANMHQQFLSDAVSGAGDYDVFTVDQPWVPEFAQQGFLMPLDDRLSDEDRADFMPNTLETVTYDGALYGLPYMVHNKVLYYRTDLFEAAGIEGPPTTWEEYRDYAARLTDPAAGVWGTIIPGKQDGEVATRFESFIQQAGGDIVDDEGNPTLDTPEARAALEMMQAIQNEDQSSPPGLHDLTDIQGQFLEGKVAMVLVWPYLYSLASDPEQSQIAGNFALALSPGNPDQVSTTFSWGFGVNSATDNPDAAWEWVKFATSSQILEEISRSQFAPVPRQSVTEALAASDDLSDADRMAFEVFADSVSRSTTIPMTPAYPQYQEAMAVAVSAVMSGSQDVDTALATAQRTAEEAHAAVTP